MLTRLRDRIQFVVAILAGSEARGGEHSRRLCDPTRNEATGQNRHNPPGQLPFGLGLRCALGRVSRGYTPSRAPRPGPKGSWQTVFYPGVWSVSGLSIALIIMVLGRACSKPPPRARGNGAPPEGRAGKSEIRNPKSEGRRTEGAWGIGANLVARNGSGVRPSSGAASSKLRTGGAV